ncbi:amidohydrolase family protein [Chelatococcus asaccharovorans]|uniref:amidohydrolase family protein n=1 Tax=Chelatococcus asaccharovorans TaxID=28210 RepID=UPI0022645EA3|nr:amidohydrolase family protein [Chelatococcus asaccharovorans]
MVNTGSDSMKIDCDIHPGVPGVEALLPYMSDFWREQFVNREIDGMEIASYPPTAPISCRPDWREKGRPPGSSLETVRRQALDGLGLSLAICNPLYGGQVAMSEHMGTAVSAAVNDWIRHEWLDREPRLRASIVVAAQDPIAAAEEIDRCASSDRRFVQVLMLVANELTLGRRYYWPIFEAAQRHGLPIGIHAGSMQRYPATPTGSPTHLLQDYASAPQMFCAQVQSLLCEGVFSKFPDLTFVLIESGVGWVVPFMWRSTKTWRGVRGEVPWMKRPAIDEVRDRIRMTIQPFDGPDAGPDLERFIEQLGSDDILLFSSDYPHWHFEGSDAMPPGLSSELARKIAWQNPLNTYPRLRESLS